MTPGRNNMNVRARNPANPRQMLAFYDSSAAFAAGELRNAWTVMTYLSLRQHFTILDRVPQSLAGGWDYWIEHAGTEPTLPAWARWAVWKRIGQR